MTRYMPVLSTKAVGPGTSTTDDGARDLLEAALLGALAEVAATGTDRTLTRLRAPKQRKGTRHFTPEYDVDTRVGVKALDTAKVVDLDRWASDAADACLPLIEEATTAAAQAMLDDLGGAETKALIPGALTLIGKSASAATTSTVAMISRAARGRAERLSAMLNAADQAGADLPNLIDMVKELAAENVTWAKSVAVQAATAALEGARDALSRQLQADVDANDPAKDIVRQWISRLDERVRPSHALAHGQIRDAGLPFVVGDALLAYPGDPSGPPGEVRNCRCRTAYRHKGTGRFVRRPV